MPVTITGGVSFTGNGVTMSGPAPAPAPSPTVATAGWFSGGNNQNVPTNLSSVNRVTYATDTATASVRGPLSANKYQAAGTGTLSYGWIAGGAPTQCSVDRITYSTDTATASIRGPLGFAVSTLAATSDNTTYGWFGGGWDASFIIQSNVQRITYSTDTATATTRGPLSLARMFPTGAGTSTYGWFGGGRLGAPSYAQVSTVDRITYATDTAVAGVRGPLFIAVEQSGATGNTTYGWWGGGYSPGAGPQVSTVSRITYATDTATAVSRGSLGTARSSLIAAGNDTDGWYSGGVVGSVTSISVVDRINYATDTAVASTKGPLATARQQHSGTTGAQ